MREKCPYCDGRGASLSGENCYQCEGLGYIPEVSTRLKNEDSRPVPGSTPVLVNTRTH